MHDTGRQFLPETHTERLVTQYGCLPSLLADEDKGIAIVSGEKINILYWADYRAAKTEQKNFLYRHDKPKEPTKEGPLSFVLFESHIHLSFNSRQGPPLSSFSGSCPYSMLVPAASCLPVQACTNTLQQGIAQIHRNTPPATPHQKSFQ
jgi:hypothetical protein